MANIGYTTQGTAGTTTLENVIAGCIGTTGSEGTYTVDKIVAYINPSATQFTTKCAIYTTAGALVSNSETSVVTGVSGAGWRDFTYSGTKPTLSASTTYVIVAWTQSRSGTNVISYDTSTSNGRTVASTYGTFPASVTFTTNNNRASIYAVTLFALTGSAADSANNLSDATTLLLNQLATPSDTLSLSDTFTAHLYHWGDFTDTLSQSDFVEIDLMAEVVLQGIHVEIDDSLQSNLPWPIEDIKFNLGLTFPDSITLSDAIEYLGPLNLDFVDATGGGATTSFSDSLAALLDHFGSFSDQFTLSDNLTTFFEELTTPLDASGSDTLASSDSLELFSSWLYPTADSLSITDALNTFSANFLVKDDTLTLSDSVIVQLASSALDLPIGVTDSLSLDDFTDAFSQWLFEVGSGLGQLDSVSSEIQTVHIRYGIYDRFDAPWLDAIEGIQFPLWFYWESQFTLSDSVATHANWLVGVEDTLTVSDVLETVARESDDERYFRAYVNDMEELVL